ncbi:MULTISPECIES: thiamine pyrophosphate-binding protein [unclassified Polynucleobacter]|uniref:thiamine pyrophosphate-binding protein n=1 Tax=unclassified Polynucleobacter TaxID=2640945 RepID=UPI000B2A1ECC|nr:MULTISPECIES: thiamine pyrophosphate-binding protein [unclassified Polynucleobacter]HBK42808.1 acetolactate synthase [Polynucleobacter sp.]
MITIADYVALFLAQNNIKHVFGMTGGASLHLIHAIRKRADIEMVFTHHEQSAAMCADAYSRVSKNLGAAIATSGPGATNLITGICCSFFDSVPTIYITGQVSTFRSNEGTGVRQIGFQETNIVEICRPITKYVVKLTDANLIRHELEKCRYIALMDRPGPVLIDIPDNLQRVEIDPMNLKSFEIPDSNTPPIINTHKVGLFKLIKEITRSKRPVVIVGWGARLSHAEEVLAEFLSELNFPILPTWAAVDLFDPNDERVVGTFGTHGTRAGNYTVQNADFILVLGSRLDTHATGSPPQTFARDALKFVVDIDPHEINKFEKIGIRVEEAFCLDIRKFIELFLNILDKNDLPNIDLWRATIKSWKDKYPPGIESKEHLSVNPYDFMKSLSEHAESGDQIVSDTGCALAWAMQSFKFKDGQRFFHAFNNTPMGYALPAAIACAFVHPDKKIICIVGDGSIQLNIQELATIAHHKLNIKIFVINNFGYSMIKQTQDQWLNSEYVGSSITGGLSMPNFPRVAEAYGINSFQIETQSSISEVLTNVFNLSGPVLCDVHIPDDFRVAPQVKYGFPIEDGEPFLRRDEFLCNMIVEPLSVSLTRGKN